MEVYYCCTQPKPFSDFAFSCLSRYPHQESIRVPLIIHDPRMKDELKGTTNDAFTLNIDLAPTILAAAGIETPEKMMGRDMSPLYLDQADWREEL